MKIKLRNKPDGRRNNGKNLKGNSIEDGVHPNVLTARMNFSLGKAQAAKPKKKALTEATEDILNKVVIIDGVEQPVTVAQQIIKQRALEAMQPNDFNDNALKATQMLWDRSEGRPVNKNVLSGPDDGPIETVETNVILAKLFS